MAQTGFTPIQLYSTSTAAAAPAAGNLTNSTLGSELAINITDGKLFYKDNANAVQVIGWKTVPTTAGGTGLTTYTAGDLSYYASGTTFTKLAIGTAGQILTSTGSAPQWSTLSGVAVTTFSAGTTGFTPNSATSGAVTLAGTLATTNGGTGLTSFTANGVLYASSTSALATGSALTFDGTNFVTTGAATATRFIPSGSTVPTNGLYLPSANAVGIASNSTLRMFFASGGNIGIGSSTNINAKVTFPNDNTLGFQNASGAMTGGSAGAWIVKGTDNNWYFDNFEGDVIFRGASYAERAKITSAGNISITNGNLVIATSGKGIDFSATAGTGTSELLADYEEGTWTPTFSTWSTAPSVEFATYTKVGRLVTLNLLCLKGVCNAGSSINGLPFTATSSNGASAFAHNSNSNNVAFYGGIFNGGTSISNLSAVSLTNNNDYWVLSTTYIA